MCQNCNQSRKTVDHLATRCEKILGHNYTRRHNEVVRCIHLLLLNKYKFKSSKRIRSHSVQEILYNEYAEIRVDTRIKTDVNIRCNRPDIFVSDKRKNKIPLIEVGITSPKIHFKHELAGLIYKCSVEIISYGITWDGIITKYHNMYVKRLQIPKNRALLTVILGAVRHKQPTPSLKEKKNKRDVVKQINTENIIPFVWMVLPL
ncbi:hypothetical protein CWI39_0345p0010 [Hamiltosporidium magnivora]|uniref:Reverse transcriptase n=1 Tax=Hamiltosporidium magnivora TaxID=148818 RepID=A0A4Q9LJK1_9MICR|nr:hypothetical protein CWI39_0345p0010 [Hamiltosporidium magnivora]